MPTELREIRIEGIHVEEDDHSGDPARVGFGKTDTTFFRLLMTTSVLAIYAWARLGVL